MLKYLPETIQSFSTQSRATVSSLVQSVKSDKAQVALLIQNLRSFDLASNYGASLALRFSRMEVEGVVEFFRDSSLRVREFFSASSSLASVLNSMVAIYDSEIQKLEKDIQHLQSFIDTYQFISGEDDLYNFNYVENFDNDLNSYISDSPSIQMPDRDGIPFANNGNYFIDSPLSKLAISKGIDFTNQSTNIRSISVESNAQQYITTDSGIESALNEDPSDQWMVSVKSPTLVSSQLPGISAALPYDSSSILGHKYSVTVDFIIPVEMDTIRLNPSLSSGLSLLQVVLTNTDPISTSVILNAQGEYLETPVLNAPLAINKPVDVVFNICKVSKIKFIFNQFKYTKTENIPINQEALSKTLAEIIESRRKKTSTNTSKLQDIVYYYFNRSRSINEIKKRNRNYTEYYSYRYPLDDSYSEDFFLKQIVEKNDESNLQSLNMSVENSNSNILHNMVESIVHHVIGSRNNLFNTKVYRTIPAQEESGRLYNLRSDGLIPAKKENQNYDLEFQRQDPTMPGIDANSATLYLSNREASGQYEYTFAIKNILFGTTSPSSSNKACYISKKIETNGAPLGVKAIVNKVRQRRDLTISNYDLSEPGSYELSISYVDIPTQESDWISVLANENSVVDSEVLFFNNLQLSELRFKPEKSSIRVYRNCVLVNPNDWEYVETSNSILMNSDIDQQAIYTVSYSIENNYYIQNFVDIDRALSSNFAVKAFSSGGNPGERFSSTNPGNKIVLSYTPFVEQKFDNAYYSELYGTINTVENIGYSPITVLLQNGQTAINLTNYINNSFVKGSFYQTDEYLFFQSGKELIFNKPINIPFTVNYSYMPASLRFRLILRNNLPNQYNGISIDNVAIKCKVKNLDPFSNKLLRLR
jgi:hypothetical protein